MHLIIPRKDTIPEKICQNALKGLGIEFTTHKAILGQPDIFIEPNICIFVDGDYWHNKPQVKERDVRVNEGLKAKGFRVIRIWEHEIKKPDFDIREYL